MPWKILYYNDSVYRNIRLWPAKICASYLRIIDIMVQSGPNLGMPFTRALCNGLFEVRARGQEGIGRGFFCYAKGKRIVILHGFIKKTNSTPRNELIIANMRMKEVQRDAKREL